METEDQIQDKLWVPSSATLVLLGVVWGQWRDRVTHTEGGLEGRVTDWGGQKPPTHYLTDSAKWPLKVGIIVTPNSRMRKPSLSGVSNFSIKMLLMVEEKELISSALGGASQIYLLPKLNVFEGLIFYVDLVFTLCSISVCFNIKMMFLVIYQWNPTNSPSKKTSNKINVSRGCTSFLLGLSDSFAQWLVPKVKYEAQPESRACRLVTFWPSVFIWPM